MQEIEMKKENKSPLFIKAKESAIKYLEKYYSDNGKQPIDEYNNKKIDQVVALKDFPDNNAQLHRIPASAKAIIMKAHLKVLYPDSKFSIVKPHFGSLDVIFKDGAYPFGIQQKIEKIYVNAGNSDMQSDYYDYDLHILFINEKGEGSQHFYKDIGDAINDLDDLIQKKKQSNKDYYDKAIKYLVDLVGVKA